MGCSFLYMLIFCKFLVQILGKAEFLNPGGSVKDRVAAKIIEEVIDPSLFVLNYLCLF